MMHYEKVRVRAQDCQDVFFGAAVRHCDVQRSSNLERLSTSLVRLWPAASL